MTTPNAPAGLLETVVRRSETPPWPALYRLAIGFLLVPAFASSRLGDGPDWRLFPFFLFILLLLRIVPAILRHLLPFSRDLQDHWFQDRLRAKRYDSYQWRKLLWVGFGLVAYIVLLGTARGAQSFLAIACLLAGALGELRWRRVVRTSPTPVLPSPGPVVQRIPAE